MKKITAIILFFLTAAVISCSDSSSSDIEVGYNDPGLSTAKTVAIKSYSIAGQSCSGTSCGAIIYTATINSVSYVGIGMDNYLSGASKFSLKIYWEGSSIPDSIDSTPASLKVKAVSGGNTYTTYTGNLKATIASGIDANSVTIYTITFTDTLTIGGAVTINSGDKIVAYKYPE